MSRTAYGVLGASFLWPWNALLTASSLARQKLESDAPVLYANFSSTVMTTSSVANLLSNLYLASRPLNYRWRVVYGELSIGASFLVLAITSDLISLPALWMSVVVLTVIASSVGCALVQNGMLAITQHIPDPGYALSMLNGQAVAGVLPALLPLVVSGSSSSSTLVLALCTFLSVCGLSLLSLVLFTSRDNRQFVEMAEKPDSDTSFDMEPAAVAPITPNSSTEADTPIISTNSYPGANTPFTTSAVDSTEASAAYPAGPSVSSGLGAVPLIETNVSSFDSSIEILKRIQSPCITILLGFMVSLTYPVFANSVVSRSISSEYFSPVTHLVWNSGDLLGRVLCSSSPKLRVSNTGSLVAYASSRLALVAVLVVNSWLKNPSDWLYWAIMLIFGVTNGHLISSAIARAPQLVPPHLQPTAGGLLGLVISVGLLLGSGFSFVVVYLI